MKLLFTLLIVAAVTLAAAHAAGTSCRAITFSGAGAFGAYEAGVLWGLTAKRPADEVEWQFATGISAGSINAAGAAMFSVGNEQGAAEFLTSRWMGITPEQIYVNWVGGLVDGLLLQKGIFNDAPLHKFLSDNLNLTALHQSTRGLLIGATNIDTGNFDIFEKTDPEIVLGVQASSSIPGVFPPTFKGNAVYQDGGVTYMTPVTDTARLCYGTGATDVTIDVVVVGDLETTVDMNKAKTIDLLLRTLDIVKTNMHYKDIETVFEAFPNVNLNVFHPSQPLPGNALSFTYSGPLIKIGYEDAITENTTIGLTKDNYKSALNKAFGLNL
ncbi:hypothetical protein SAMD00019534_096890 [Acytostelium subglobosum LB1]|uniref:hypothetical protein n=1 Tax=Acytostelium subglobosum LB1 TaxID=1410327 RepID=UPI000644F647|nr:hypothetical protein SAMD00019534_096890 [Acytostelium subglobosum LB1]GAM26514.1 hypothetical protein SAMD00019534_096890 [Acytostelium subglobosum LB1]|eukprot:XP_012750610.1 hypothetical protein SAMD00019534_096890 [Acytostelium subglobosum LB1]